MQLSLRKTQCTPPQSLVEPARRQRTLLMRTALSAFYPLKKMMPNGARDQRMILRWQMLESQQRQQPSSMLPLLYHSQNFIRNPLQLRHQIRLLTRFPLGSYASINPLQYRPSVSGSTVGSNNMIPQGMLGSEREIAFVRQQNELQLRMDQAEAVHERLAYDRYVAQRHHSELSLALLESIPTRRAARIGCEEPNIGIASVPHSSLPIDDPVAAASTEVASSRVRRENDMSLRRLQPKKKPKKKDTKWLLTFEQLKAYRKEHGDCVGRYFQLEPTYSCINTVLTILLLYSPSGICAKLSSCQLGCRTT